jgi:hypothetical protein
MLPDYLDNLQIIMQLSKEQLNELDLLAIGAIAAKERNPFTNGTCRIRGDQLKSLIAAAREVEEVKKELETSGLTASQIGKTSTTRIIKSSPTRTIYPPASLLWRLRR